MIQTSKPILIFLFKSNIFVVVNYFNTSAFLCKLIYIIISDRSLHKYNIHWLIYIFNIYL